MITCYFEESKRKVFLRHVVVDMLVVKDNKILLVKRGGHKWFLGIGKWALPGGFLDRDETAEQAAMRETLEETGYQSKVAKFLGVIDNPQRPHEKNRQNVSLVYLMQPIKKVGDHDKEVSEIKWFALDNLPLAKDMAFDHLEIIKLYQKSLDK